MTARPLGEAGRDCGIGTVCQAARTSLGKEFEPRVLIALDPTPADARVEGESAVRSLRRVLRAMFVGGADAVLLHAHVEGSRAVFALLDALFILNFQFSDGPEPAAPHPDCGPGSSDLGCETAAVGCE